MAKSIVWRDETLVIRKYDVERDQEKVMDIERDHEKVMELACFQ